MTQQEAREYMENEIRCVQRSKFCDRDCGKCDLVKEDKPLIEAYGLAVLALEKQIPKKPVVEDIKDHEGTDIDAAFRCPKCNRVVCFYAENDIEKEYPYCHCGQALDWSDTE